MIKYPYSKLLAGIGVSLLLVSCGGGGSSSTTTDGGGTITNPPDANAVLSTISLSPKNAIMKVGSSQQMSAIGSYSDGGQANVTGSVTWSASGYGAVTISSGGVVTAVKPGDDIITATQSTAWGTTYVYASTYGSEGSIAAPQALTLETEHAGEVNYGGPGTGNGYSYYAVNVTPGASYYAFLTGLDGDAHLELYDDSNFSHKVCYSKNSGTADEVCYAVGPASGILYVAVNGDDTNYDADRGAAYKLTVRAGYKDEGPSAAPLTPALNTPYSGQVGRLVSDYSTGSFNYLMYGTSRYRYTLAPTGRYTISVTSSTGPVTFMVLDEFSVVVCETNYWGTVTTGTCSFQAETATANVYVSGEGTTVGTNYTITMQEDHGAYVDEGSYAAPMSLTTLPHHGHVVNSSWYSIPVTANQSVQIQATSVDGNLGMYVYDGNQTSIACKKFTLDPADLVCLLEPSTTGTVYVNMTPNGGLGTGFFLNVTPISYPPQGTQAAPQVLVTAPVYSAPYAGTVDSTASYYQIPVTTGKLYRVGLAKLAGDVSLTVYDNAALTTQLCTSNATALAAESCQATPSGNYLWIKVGGNTYGSKFELTVDRIYVQKGTKASPLNITSFLPSYTGGETGPGTSDTERTHLMAYLTAGKSYTFTVSNNTDPELDVWVFDNSAFSYPYECAAEKYNGYTCTVKPLYTGAVYMWVTSRAPYGSAFDLSINESAFATQGTASAPVTIGAFPVVESVGRSQLKYTGGEVNGTNSYYVADVSGGYPYVKFAVGLVNQSADVDLYVYDDAGFTHLLCSSVGAGLNETCTNLSPAGTQLYIKVSGATNGFGGMYDLTVDHDYVSEGAVSTGNGGSLVINSVPLLVGVPYQGEAKAGVSSYYYLTGFSAGTHTVTLSNLFDSTCMWVYNEADGKFLTTSVGSSNDNFLTDKTITASFTSGVFVQVSSCGYTHTGTAYTITIN